jgi:hypothetical protein
VDRNVDGMTDAGGRVDGRMMRMQGTERRYMHG